MVDKLKPDDSRVQHKTTEVNGRTYSYILAEPDNGAKPVATIFLIHGWPDLAFGWRYQIPALTALNLRVVVPNMQGYSKSSSPQDLSNYTYKAAADDVAAIAEELGASSIILGGHDWGGAVVGRIALHYPELISGFVSVCTPFFTPKSKFVPMTVLPNFKYQLHLKGPDVEREIVGYDKIRQFLNGLYGGQGPNGEIGFTISEGCLFENLPKLGPTPLLSKEELDYYAQEFSINGMRGPLNWYRTGELNFEDEKELAKKFEEGFKMEIPSMYIAGTKDAALPPKMSEGMEDLFAEGKLMRREVDTSHWALWEKPEEINQYFKEFVETIVGGKSNL